MELDKLHIAYIADRFDLACSNMPQCLDCGSQQVQLLQFLNPPMEWRCRRCKKWFAKEPEAKT